MATTPEAQEAAAKERIIKHMNADHHDSIRRYLEAFQKQPFYRVQNARMSDITLSEMRFDTSGRQDVIPFDPPLKSLREARERLVQLDKDALQALGRSDISITTYIPPYMHLGHLANFTQCFLTYVVFSRDANFQPGSPLFDNLLYRLPAAASFCLTIRPYLLTIMVAIHVFEASLMAKKLSRHGVTPFQGIWWAWLASCFIEGFTSFQRIGWFIDEQRKQKEAKKH